MKASIKPIKARTSSASRRAADYYTKGETRQLSQADLEFMASYWGANGPGAVGEHPQAPHMAARWIGSGCADLGLVEGAVVSRDQFQALLRGNDPNTKTPLRDGSSGRSSVSAYDIPLGAEKDVSVLLMLLGEQGQEIWKEAIGAGVQKALEYVEEEATVVRRGHGGVVHKAASGVVGVVVTHFAARPVDGEISTHFHAHAVITNLGLGPDERWSALDAHRLFDIQGPVGAIAGVEVRRILSERLGVEWRAVPTSTGHVSWQIVGFSDDLRRRLSTRSRQIVTAMRETGVSAHAAQRMTREVKNEDCGGGFGDLDTLREKLAAEGINYYSVMAEMRQAQQAEQVQVSQAHSDFAWLTQKLGEVPAQDDHIAYRQWRLDAAKELWKAEHRIAWSWDQGRNADLDWARVERAIGHEELAATINPEPEDILDILEEVGRKSTTFDRHDLIRAASEAGLSLDDAREAVELYIAERTITIPGHARFSEAERGLPDGMRYLPGHAPLYASKATWEAEQRFIQAFENGVGTATPLCDEEHFRAILQHMAEGGKTIEPGTDQHAALHELLCGSNTIQVIAGQAGVGKSAGQEALKLACDGALAASEGTGRQVLGTALSSNAALELMEASGIDSYSLTMLLHRLDTGRIELEQGAIIVVDESSQAATWQMDKLRAAVEEVHGRLVLSGDGRQKQSVEAGGLLPYLVRKYGDTPAVAHLDQVRRQRTIAERVVLAVIHDEGTLRRHSLEALYAGAEIGAREMGVSPEEGRQIVTETLDHYFRDNRGEWLNPTAAVNACVTWYEDMGRVRCFDAMDELATEMATRYQALAAQHGESEVLAMAETNAQCAAVENAILGEKLAIQELTPGSGWTFGKKTYLPGQLITLRAVQASDDRHSDLRNGMNARVVGLVEVPTEWKTMVRTPWGPTATRKFRGVVVPLVIEVKYAARDRDRDIAYARAEVEKAQQWLDKAKSASSRSRAKTAIREAQAKLDWLSELPAKSVTVGLDVLDREATKRDLRLKVELNDDTREIKYLSESYVEKHVTPGYCRTSQVVQGATVTAGLTLGMGYVVGSRARETTEHFILLTQEKIKDLKEARDLQRKAVEAVSEVLGSDAIEQLRAAVAQKVAGEEETSAKRLVQESATVGESTVVMAATPAATFTEAGKALAACYMAELADPDAERVRGVAKTSAMAHEMNARALAELHRQHFVGKPVKIADRNFAAGGPARARKTSTSLGIEKGDEVMVIDTLPGQRLEIQLATGKREVLSAAQVATFLDEGLTGIARTALGAKEPVAERLLVVAGGLEPEDLRALGQRASTVDYYSTESEVAYELEKAILEHDTPRRQLRQDANQEKTVTQLLKEGVQRESEIALISLQEDRAIQARELARLSRLDELPPVEMAAEQTEARIRELRSKDRDLAIAVDENPDDLGPLAEQGKVQRELAEQRDNLKLLTARQTVLDPTERQEREQARDEIITEAQAKLAEAIEHVEATIDGIDNSLLVNVRARVEEDRLNPPKWLPSEPGLSHGAEAKEQWANDISTIEHFRLRWGETSEESALGEPGGNELRDKEFHKLADDLSERYPEIAAQLAAQEAAQQVESPTVRFQKIGEDEDHKPAFILAGPAGSFAFGHEVEVTLSDGRTITKKVRAVSDPYEGKDGDLYQRAAFFGGADLPPDRRYDPAQDQAIAEQRSQEWLARVMPEEEYTLFQEEEQQMQEMGPSIGMVV